MKESRFKLSAIGLAVCCFASVSEAATITGGYNVAGGRTVTSSGAFFPAQGPLTGLVDGLTGSPWLPNYGLPNDATIDLGRSYRLTDLNLTNSTWSQRATDAYNITVSTTGAFTGEQVTLVTGNMPLPAAGTTDIGITANQFGRYVRFTGTSVYSGNFGGGVGELSLGGVPNRAVSQLQATTPDVNSVSAKAFTRTTALTDAAATWSLSQVTPTSASIVQSVGKSVTTTLKDYGNITTITDGVDTAPGTFTTGEVLFTHIRQSDLSFGNATVDLGSRMIIDQLGVRNTTFNLNSTMDYVIRVANNLADFDDPNYTDAISSNFAATGEVDNFVLGTPVIGRYVRFISQTKLPVAFYTGLDELTVTGRTFTTSLLASGSGLIGGTSGFGSIALNAALPSQFNLLTLDVTTSDGLNRQTLQQVEVLPEPASLSLLGLAGLALGRRRRV